MKIVRLQLILAFVSYGKLMFLLAVYGLQGIGIVSYITSLITLLSIVGQLYNNQGVQVEYMKSSPEMNDIYRMAMKSISLYIGILAVIILYILNFFEITDFSLGYMIILGVALMAAQQNSIFDFHCTVNNKVDIYLKSQIYGSLAFLIIILLFDIFNIDEKNLILLYPSQILISFVCYKFYFKYHSIAKIQSSKFKSIKEYFLLQKRHSELNIIPLVSVSADYVVKNAFISLSGPVLVGQLQIIQSIDSLIGNIFAGPIYKKAIYDYSTNKFTVVDKRFMYYLIILLVPVFLMCIPFLFLLYVDLQIWSAYYDKLVLIRSFSWLLIVFLVAKYFTLVWGLVGQILLTYSKNYTVVYGEVGFRIAVASLTLLLFIISVSSINAYIFSYAISSVALLYFSKILIPKNSSSIKQVVNN